LNVKIKRKAVLMYYVDNAVIAKYITQRCNNVWNYENVKKGDFLSFNNKDYINAVDGKYVFFKYKYSICLSDMIQRLPKLPDYYVKMENFEKDIKSLWFVKENLGSLSTFQIECPIFANI
jgi:hypothetical protein